MWWIRSDPCGLFSALLTVLLMLYSQYCISLLLLQPWLGLSLHTVAYTTLTLLAIISHTRAQFTDPGATPLQHVATVSEDVAVAAPLNVRMCRVCERVKPSSAHHCSACKRCIVRMDHHCPWINNCVAISNQKYFLLFLFYTCCLCIYAASLLVARFISCTNHIKSCYSMTSFSIALLVVNFIEALIFGLFVLVMMVDQISAIFSNTPYIDQLQQRRRTVKQSKFQSLKQVFGEESLSLRWLLPLATTELIRKQFNEELQVFAESDYMQGGQLFSPHQHTRHHSLPYSHVHHQSYPSSLSNGSATYPLNAQQLSEAFECYAQLSPEDDDSSDEEIAGSGRFESSSDDEIQLEDEDAAR